MEWLVGIFMVVTVLVGGDSYHEVESGMTSTHYAVTAGIRG